MITLRNTTDIPPGGYAYIEPAIGLVIPAGTGIAIQGLLQVVQAVMQARANNPSAGLDPSYEACLRAVKVYTCQRLAVEHPRHLMSYCGPEVVTAKTAQRGGCRSCGRR